MVISVVLGPVLLADNGVRGVGEPEVVIQISQSKQTAYVEPGQDGIVTFSGAVFVSIPWSPEIQYLVVELESECRDFPVSVPPALTFSKHQKQQSFALSVQVPIGTSSLEDYVFYVNGTWSYSPGVTSGDCEGAAAIIVVQQYFDMELYCDDPFVESLRPNRMKLSFQAENTGNGDDTVVLEIGNMEELSGSGIDVILGEREFPLKLGETRSIELLVDVEEDARIGTYEVLINGRSSTADRMGYAQDTEELIIYVEIVRELSEPQESEEPQEPEEPGEPEEPEEPEETDGSYENGEETGTAAEEEDTSDEGSGETMEYVEDHEGENEGSDLVWVMVLAAVLVVIAAALAVYFGLRSKRKRISVKE